MRASWLETLDETAEAGDADPVEALARVLVAGVDGGGGEELDVPRPDAGKSKTRTSVPGFPARFCRWGGRGGRGGGSGSAGSSRGTPMTANSSATASPPRRTALAAMVRPDP